MTYTIETRDYVHIPEHSFYNHNYYRNIHTGEVILGEYEDDGCGTYYNLGQIHLLPVMTLRRLQKWVPGNTDVASVMKFL